ncbi:MAG: tyrosine-type recombinase/integrase [Plesiomonas sp.]|uniref:tyrosine-type recombinase/integrase n=1 Tax=Plesiomonas sp. TaxID=2486279 RepID=UPI003F3C41D9
MAGGISILSKNTSLIQSNPDLDEDVVRNLNNFVKDKDAFSENTWNQLMTTVRQWCRWCISKGYPYLPVDPDYLRDYLIELHESGLASTTISNYAAMLNMLHRQAGLTPPGSSNKVKLALKKINRVSVTKGESTGQAVQLTMSDLNKLDEVWGKSDRLKDIRNLAFIFIAYNTLLRISNLARLKVKDISFQSDGTLILNIGYTKTIVTGHGVTKALSKRSSDAVIRWLNVSGLIEHSDAYLFCRVHRVNKAIISTEKELTRPNLTTIFTDAWVAIHGDKTLPDNKGRYQRWSGHSARVGAAQDMAKAGVSLPQIMHEGTWTKAETVLGYIRNIDAKNSVMIDLIETGSAKKTEK